MLTTKDIEKINKYIESLDAKQLANLLKVVADGIQRAEKNSLKGRNKPLTEKEKQFIAFHQLCHEMVKAERSLANWFHNKTEDIAINNRIPRDDYIYRGGNDDVVRKAGCDMWKFETWLSKCPVTIYKREDCANGWIEMHFIIDDERDED